MAQEATLQITMNIKTSRIDRKYTKSFKPNVSSTANGPSPGAFTASVGGTIIDFSAIGTPRLCWVENYDATNFVTIGLYDGSNFFPVFEVLPGEAWPIPLSRYLNQEFQGTGTGTNADVNDLMIIADTAPCRVSIEGFGR